MFFEKFSFENFNIEYKSFSDITDHLYFKFNEDTRKKIEEFFWQNASLQIKKYLGADEKVFKKDDLKIPYFEIGDNSKPTLVFIHGFADSKENFYKTAKLLSENYHLIIPDVPGFADASKCPGYTYNLTQYSKWFHQFFETLELRNFHLMGNSLGGAIALQLALDFPHLLRSLTLMDNGAILPLKSASLYDELNRGDIIFCMNNKEQYEHFVSRVFFDPPYTPTPLKFYFFNTFLERRDWYKKMIDDIVSGTGNNTPIEEQLKLCLNHRLKEVSAPTLIMWGDQDTLFPVEVAAIEHTQIPNSSLAIFEDCGHAPHIEAPKKVVKAFERFLKEKGVY